MKQNGYWKSCEAGEIGITFDSRRPQRLSTDIFCISEILRKMVISILLLFNIKRALCESLFPDNTR